MPAAPRTDRRAGEPSSDAARLFAALGDENRLRLVRQLCEGGPVSITRLADACPISRQGVTKHLRTMERAGLVRSRRRGRELQWQIEPPRLDDARRYLDQVSEQWDAALERLRRFVDG